MTTQDDDRRFRFRAYHEKLFLDGLGKFSDKHNKNKKSRKELLENYINVWSQRKNWDGIDGLEVLDHANTLLFKEVHKVM